MTIHCVKANTTGCFRVHLQPVAVVLDLVHPQITRRRLFGGARTERLNEARRSEPRSHLGTTRTPQHRPARRGPYGGQGGASGQPLSTLSQDALIARSLFAVAVAIPVLSFNVTVTGSEAELVYVCVPATVNRCATEIRVMVPADVVPSPQSPGAPWPLPELRDRGTDGRPRSAQRRGLSVEPKCDL